MKKQNLQISKTKSGYFSDSNDNAMYTLSAAIREIPMAIIQPLINAEIQANNIPMDYHFNTFGIKINPNKTFTIYYLTLEDDPSFYLTIDQGSYWKAIEEYEKLENLDWKKLTISFDGNQVYFDPEY